MEPIQELTPKHLLVPLEIPVTVVLRGIAKIHIPIDASLDQIDDALETVDPLKLAKMEPVEEDQQWWSPATPYYLYLLAHVGKAFRALDAQNIAPVAHEYDNSGSTSAAEELLDTEERYIGYVYIHSQSVERLITKGEGNIGFGSRSMGDGRKHIEIGMKVKAALEAEEAFHVVWDGSSEKKIDIKSRRRPRAGF